MEEMNHLKQARVVQGMALVKSLTKQLILNKASDYNIANQLKVLSKITKKQEWRTVYQVNRQWPSLVQRHLKFNVKDALCVIPAEEIVELKAKPNELFFAYADYLSPSHLKEVTFSIYFPHSRPKHVYSQSLLIP